MSSHIAPETVAILFADLQKGIVDGAQTERARDVIKAATAMADIASLLGLPALVQMVQIGPDAPKLADDLAHALPDAPVHVRHTAHALDHAPTRDALAATGRKVLGLCGVASEVVVLHAALGARALGYEVYVLVDACGGLSERTEAAAFRQIERAGGITTAVASFATAISGDFTTDRGRAVIARLRKLMG